MTVLLRVKETGSLQEETENEGYKYFSIKIK